MIQHHIMDFPKKMKYVIEKNIWMQRKDRITMKNMFGGKINAEDLL